MSAPLCTVLASLSLLCGSAASMAQDPMRPPGGAPRAARASAALQVQGIITHGSERIAIVNGALVRTGERIGDALIERVLIDRIEYRRGGRLFTAVLTDSSANLRISSSTPAESP
jgi:hypothetical protein